MEIARRLFIFKGRGRLDEFAILFAILVVVATVSRTKLVKEVTLHFDFFKTFVSSFAYFELTFLEKCIFFPPPPPGPRLLISHESLCKYLHQASPFLALLIANKNFFRLTNHGSLFGLSRSGLSQV